MYATQTGWNAARRAWSDLGEPETDFQSQTGVYELYLLYYLSRIFDQATRALTKKYRQENRTYRYIDDLHNPCEQLVEFYVANIYPGTLTKDGLPTSNGTPSAIPFTDDTPPELIAAIAQIWQWSNWGNKKAVQVRLCAIAGEIMTEIIDDVAHGNVWLDLIWPTKIKDLDLDNKGNVKGYVLEYVSKDEDNKRFIYRKEVTKRDFRYFKDGQPFDYGYGSIVPNPYNGLVPATWTKHKDMNQDHGLSVIAGLEPLMDRLNGLASHIIDHCHEVAENPSVLWGGNSIITASQNVERLGATDDLTEEQRTQDSVRMLAGPVGGHIESLVQPIDLAGVDAQIGRLLAAIDKKKPELVVDERLMQMAQVSGIAVQRILNSTVKKVEEAQSQYDTQNIKAWQIAVGIAGERYKYRVGGWSRNTPQQQKFDGYGLDSYERGDLDMSIAERPLLPPTRTEVAQEDMLFWQAVNAASDAGVPLEMILEDKGWPPEKIAKLRAEKEARAERIRQDQMLAQDDMLEPDMVQ